MREETIRELARWQGLAACWLGLLAVIVTFAAYITGDIPLWLGLLYVPAFVLSAVSSRMFAWLARQGHKRAAARDLTHAQEEHVINMARWREEWEARSVEQVCPSCHGDGYHYPTRGDGVPVSPWPCWRCLGKGRIRDLPLEPGREV
jgi:hypothetical protein